MHAPMFKHLVVAAMAAACAAVAIAGCSSSSSGPSSGCSGVTECANGAGSMQACYTQDVSGACATLSYMVGSRVFDCVSCDDEAYCKNAALVACGVPEASIPDDADLPEGATLFTDSGAPADATTNDTGAGSVDSGPSEAAASNPGDAAHD